MIIRRIPRSNLGRQLALQTALWKQSTLLPTEQVLSNNTKARLIAALPLYKTALANISINKANVSTNAQQKKKEFAKLKLLVNHFIQVFNLGVDRDEYPAAHRGYYRLPEGRGAVPAMHQYFEILRWAKNLADGDAKRIAAGGAPMANPTAAQVLAQHDLAKTVFSNQSIYTDAFRHAQKDLGALNRTTNTLIKRIWNEVEAYYGEKPAEGMRNSARAWGVQYVSVGKAKAEINL